MSLIPYLFVAGYGLMIARRGETYDVDPQDRSRDLVLAGIATVYTIFMLLAGGSRYLLLSSVLYAPGTALYIWSRREQGRQAFTPIELGIFAILAFGCVAGIYALAKGQLAL